jgi:hypothetical protein
VDRHRLSDLTSLVETCCGAENGEVMLILEAAAVLGLVGLVLYGLFVVLARPRPDASAVSGGRWRVAHYEAGGETRVVVQKVSVNGVNVLDEHVVARLAVDDPDYDQRFLAAMSVARERRALFEAEDEP